MARSLAAILLILILPCLAPAQAPAQEVSSGQENTHEVVRGETLWALADRYLGNPFRWPLIHEANATRVQNPHLIFPGQVLIIPGIGEEAARVREVMVVAPGDVPAPEQRVALPAGGAWVQASGGGTELCPGMEDRTVFYAGEVGTRDCAPSGPPGGVRTSFYSAPADPGGDVQVGLGPEPGRGPSPSEVGIQFAVPMGFVYGAEWLESPGEEAGSVGALAGITDVHAHQNPGGPARRGERVLISPEGGTDLRVGDLLQTYRPLWEDRRLGVAYRPTGILVVSGSSDEGILALVSSEFDRIQVGDRVRPAPDYPLLAGRFPSPVESNVTGVVLAFPEDRSVQGLGAKAFLDVGENQGIVIGDVFRAIVDEPGPLFGMEAAELQVVSVEGGHATARITGVRHPGLESGDLLRLIAKMQ